MRTLLASVLFIPYILSFSFSNDSFGDFSNRSFDKTESLTSDTLVQMERTICFGTCPAYTLTIQKNGEVTFNGKEFVEHKGIVSGEMSQKELDKLIQKIRKSHFMNMPSDPECETRYTDMPSFFLTIRLDGKEHSINHYHGCIGFEYEEELYDLEETIDSLAGVKKWIEGE